MIGIVTLSNLSYYLNSDEFKEALKEGKEMASERSVNKDGQFAYYIPGVSYEDSLTPPPIWHGSLVKELISEGRRTQVNPEDLEAIWMGYNSSTGEAIRKGVLKPEDYYKLADTNKKIEKSIYSNQQRIRTLENKRITRKKGINPKHNNKTLKQIIYKLNEKGINNETETKPKYKPRFRPSPSANQYNKKGYNLRPGSSAYRALLLQQPQKSGVQRNLTKIGHQQMLQLSPQQLGTLQQRQNSELVPQQNAIQVRQHQTPRPNNSLFGLLTDNDRNRTAKRLGVSPELLLGSDIANIGKGVSFNPDIPNGFPTDRPGDKYPKYVVGKNGRHHPLINGLTKTENKELEKLKSNVQESKKQLNTNSKKMGRAGVDLTISLPKSVSVAWLYAVKHNTDLQKQIEQACEDTVKETLDFIEKEYTFTRELNSDSNKVEVSKSRGMVATMVAHREARPVTFNTQNKDGSSKKELVSQPHLHWHCLLLNATKSMTDNEFKSFYTEKLGNAEERSKLDAMTQARLADKLRGLGLVVRADKHNEFIIEGISEKAVKFFSQRQKIILDTVDTFEKQGLSVSKDIAQLETRLDKKQQTKSEMINQNIDIAAQNGISVSLMPNPGAVDSAPNQMPDLKELCNSLLEKKQYFTATELETAIWKARLVKVFDVDEAKKLFRKENDIIQIDGNDPLFKNPIFTTKAKWEKEKKIEKLLKNLTTNKPATLQNINTIVEKYSQEKSISFGKPVHLTTEQQIVLQTMCDSSGGMVSAINAGAGTGKTFTADFIQKVYAENGYTNTLALAPSNKAKNELGTSLDAKAFTIDSAILLTDEYKINIEILKSNKLNPNQTSKIQQRIAEFENSPLGRFFNGEKTLVMADEYGMVGFENHGKLVELINEVEERNKVFHNLKEGEAHNKAILIFDHTQLKPVAGGSPARRIYEQNLVPLATMSNVSRQTVTYQRELSEKMAKAYVDVAKNNENSVSGQQAQFQDLSFKNKKEAEQFVRQVINRHFNYDEKDTKEARKSKNEKLSLKIKPQIKYEQVEVGTDTKGKPIYRLNIKNIEFTNEETAADFAKKITDYKGYTVMADVIDTYDRNGKVTTNSSQEDSIKNAVGDFLADAHINIKDKIIITSKNYDVNMINEVIHNTRVANNEVFGEVEFYNEKSNETFKIGINDRILYTDNDKALGLSKGVFGEVIDMKKENNAYTFTLKLEDDREVIVKDIETFEDLGKAPFKLGYSSTVHSLQGATVKKSYVIDSTFQSFELNYVSLTRHKDDVQIYTTFDLMETIRNRSSRLTNNHNLLDLQINNIKEANFNEDEIKTIDDSLENLTKKQKEIDELQEEIIRKKFKLSPDFNSKKNNDNSIQLDKKNNTINSDYDSVKKILLDKQNHIDIIEQEKKLDELKKEFENSKIKLVLETNDLTLKEKLQITLNQSLENDKKIDVLLNTKPTPKPEPSMDVSPVKDYKMENIKDDLVSKLSSSELSMFYLENEHKIRPTPMTSQNYIDEIRLDKDKKKNRELQNEFQLAIDLAANPNTPEKDIKTKLDNVLGKLDQRTAQKILDKVVEQALLANNTKLLKVALKTGESNFGVSWDFTKENEQGLSKLDYDFDGSGKTLKILREYQRDDFDRKDYSDKKIFNYLAEKQTEKMDSFEAKFEKSISMMIDNHPDLQSLKSELEREVQQIKVQTQFIEQQSQNTNLDLNVANQLIEQNDRQHIGIGSKKEDSKNNSKGASVLGGAGQDSKGNDNDNSDVKNANDGAKIIEKMIKEGLIRDQQTANDLAMIYKQGSAAMQHSTAMLNQNAQKEVAKDNQIKMENKLTLKMEIANDEKGKGKSR